MSLENKFCDLHTHSTYSDGTWTPSEIVAEAKRLGIAVALTDHNTVAGLPEFVRAAEELGVEAVPGVELSADCFGKEMHVLALFVKESAYDDITAFTDAFRGRKAENNRELVRRLAEAGYVIDLDGIMAENPDGYINRAHIASELTRMGYTKSVDDAFRTLLSPKYGYYIPCPKPSALSVIDFIESIGALSVIAHPYLKFTTEELERFIPEAKNHGLCGMETVYSLYSAETEREAAAVAEKYGLLKSGGSDFHGDRKPDIKLAVGKGGLAVPYEYYLRLREYAER